MPRYPVPRVQRWAAEEPSVLESPMERGLRTAAQWIGLDQPTQPAELVNPAVNIYWNNPAARALETNVFVDKAAKLGKAMHEAAQNFAKRYPRMAAHIDPYLDQSLVDASGTSAARVNAIPDAVTKTSKYKKGGKVPIAFSPSGIERQSTVERAKDLLFHEGTHGAQQLGNEQFGWLNSHVTDYLGDALPNYTPYGQYRMIPFEKSAYRRGAMEGGEAVAPPVNAIEALKGILKTHGREVSPVMYDKIVDILKQRGHDITGFEKWGGGTY